ncbi:dynein axonemal heavy chain, partial [Mytilus galloprovincialis]
GNDQQKKSPRKSPRSPTFNGTANGVNGTNGVNGHDVLPEIGTEIPPSRPFTPNEQLDIMRAFEDHEITETGEPSSRDEEKGVKRQMLAAPHPDTMKNIRSLVPPPLLSSTSLTPMVRDLTEEVQKDYEFSLRKTIVDYILKDPTEKERLHIAWTPKPFPHR